MKEKVLYDFDIGTEVDDAIALAYLLANKDCELVGITTSTGEAVKRAQLASVLCKVAEKDIPIKPGCEKPILAPQVVFSAPQTAILDKWDHDTDFEPNSAIPFMQRIIRENPREITLLGTAPMTNIGLLFAMDPEIPLLLKGLMVLCGCSTYQRFDNANEKFSAMKRDDIIAVLSRKGILENNSIIDPHATSLVYQAPVKNHKTVGTNCSSRVVMTPDEAKKVFKHPILQTVMDIANIWFRDDPHVSFHDPVAAVCIFNDDVCKFESGEISVELESKLLSGFTYWRKTPDGRHSVAMDINEKKFFEHLFEVFN